MESIVNKVAESGLVTLNLEQFLVSDIAVFDMKHYLFMEMILKEKDFREQLKNLDWEEYNNKNVCITCSIDAIIPMWANMLVAAYLQPVAAQVYYGSIKDFKDYLMLQTIQTLDVNEYIDKRVVVKGCGEIPVSEKAYTAITLKLLPVVKSIMYGEPCSTVPIFKQKK